MSVLVPQLLWAWVGGLRWRAASAHLRRCGLSRSAAPPVPPQVAEAAWALGTFPRHTKAMASLSAALVVSVNRVGDRQPGTAGRALEGLSVSIDDGEIVVDGPLITDGYLGGGAAERPWRTGDLGAIDGDGFLTIHGRKDNLLVTAFGRNVSPEWIETLLLGDGRIAFSAVTGYGEPHLTALLVPSLRTARAGSRRSAKRT